MEEISRLPNSDYSTVPKHNKRTKYGRYTNDISKEEIEAHFDKSSEEAAVALGVGKTILKRICRKFGIERWPYKRLERNKRYSKSNRAQDQYESGQDSFEARSEPHTQPASAVNGNSLQEEHATRTSTQGPFAHQIAQEPSEHRSLSNPRSGLLQERKASGSLGHESPVRWQQQPAAVNIAPPPVVIVPSSANTKPHAPTDNSFSAHVFVESMEPPDLHPKTNNKSTVAPIPLPHPNGMPARQPNHRGADLPPTLSSQQRLPSAQESNIYHDIAAYLALAFQGRGIPVAEFPPLQQRATGDGIALAVPPTHPPPPPPASRVAPPPSTVVAPPGMQSKLSEEDELILELASEHVDDGDLIKSLLARAVVDLHARLAQAMQQISAAHHAAQAQQGDMQVAGSFSFDTQPITQPGMNGQPSGSLHWFQGQSVQQPSSAAGNVKHL